MGTIEMPEIEVAIDSDTGEREAEVHIPVEPSDALSKFRGAVKRVERGRRIRRGSMVAFDVDSAPAERLAAIVDLESSLATETASHRPQLVKALQKRKEGAFDGFADRATTEVYVAGSTCFHFLTPRKLGSHRRWFTWVVAFVVAILFYYMAGLWPAYLASDGAISQQCLQDKSVTNAEGLWQWIGPSGNFCIGHTFSADFLIRWGALWLPQLRAQPWRLWSTLWIHQSFFHMATNLLLWLALASYVEKTFGWWRLAILWFLSGTGGALMTGSFGNPCVANVGLSGGDFGLLGVYIVDLAENIRTSKAAIIRSIVTAILLILLIVGSVTAPNVSQWAHLGGFLSGVAPSMVMLPRLGHAHVEAWIPIVGGLWCVAYFTSLLSYVFSYRARGLDCGTPDG